MLRAIGLSVLSVIALYFALIGPVGDMYQFFSSKFVTEIQEALARE